MSKPGLFWRAYHSPHLLFWLDSESKRRDTINKFKPKDEIEARQHYLKRVEGELPVEFIEACSTHSEVNRALSKAVIMDKGYDKAHSVWHKARKVMYEAYKKHLPAIEALHAKECPDCVWDSENHTMDWSKYTGEGK